MSLKFLKYKTNNFLTFNHLILPWTQSKAEGKPGPDHRNNTAFVCFLADAPSSWWLVTAPRQWMLWCVYRAFLTTVLMGRQPKMLSEPGRAPRGAANLASYQSSPDGYPLSGCRRAAIIPDCLYPLCATLIATVLGTIARAIPVNHKYFPSERNLLLAF